MTGFIRSSDLTGLPKGQSIFPKISIQKQNPPERQDDSKNILRFLPSIQISRDRRCGVPSAEGYKSRPCLLGFPLSPPIYRRPESHSPCYLLGFQFLSYMLSRRLSPRLHDLHVLDQDLSSGSPPPKAGSTITGYDMVWIGVQESGHRLDPCVLLGKPCE
ncbi:hypothetical protein SISSUDRAFT_1133060 [Sistotremastrum suecicum HHB10207 ss-3]|uniref:Uncharacterized protein n=1 Tax=Sistotremastrum suecicum HHB10207 ss-3 TaxID=1314776 RepID=A0A165XWS3_9AGAM|nr:hypothetical protein SISSUDRAFT_1133060 [Sistotremastrum suecicum HHB10207 ss-3]